MSEPMQTPPPQPQRSQSQSSYGRLALIVVALMATAAAGFFYWKSQVEKDEPQLGFSDGLMVYIDNETQNNKLADGFVDADQDLIADIGPPRLNPDVLVFSFIGSNTPEESAKKYEPLMKHLSEKIGKKVRYIVYQDTSTPDDEEDDDTGTTEEEEEEAKKNSPTLFSNNPFKRQMKALENNRLHITAFSTGQVPRAVNQVGFVPLVCPASADGKHSYSMVIIVPASSDIKEVKQLKGKTIGLVALSSNSGGKVPLVTLKKEFDMLPGRDYDYRLTGSHEHSIEVIAKGDSEYAAACVANDLLEQEIAAGKIKKDDIRIIHKSVPFPPYAFGVPHNLETELRQKVLDALLSYTLPDASLREKFVKIDYKDDWKSVRDINTELSELLK